MILRSWLQNKQFCSQAIRPSGTALSGPPNQMNSRLTFQLGSTIKPFGLA